jgi:hypothetical protein
VTVFKNADSCVSPPKFVLLVRKEILAAVAKSLEPTGIGFKF